MKRFPTAALTVMLLALFAASCSERHGKVEIRLIATSDIHGCVFDTDAATATQRQGSMARVSSFLKQERAGHKNVVYVDCGDILQGSMEMYRDITAEFMKPSLAAQAFNLLDCQAIAMGNHDLQVGAPSYERYFRTLACPVLWGNLGFGKPGDYMPAYRIVEVGGARLAFLGLTTQNVLSTVPSDNMAQVSLWPLADAAARIIPILREQEKADVVIGLVHAGYDRDMTYSTSRDVVPVPENLAATVPGFDLIIYGHDHEPNTLRVAGAGGDSLWIANPGPYAARAVAANITLDFTAGDTPKPQISVSLEDLRDIEPDPEFCAALADRWQDVCRYSDSIAGYIDSPLVSTGLQDGEASATEYIHSIQMNFQGAQVSLAQPVQNIPVIEAGAVTISDVFHWYPYDNNMVGIMLSGSEIKSLLEYSAGQYAASHNPGSLLTAAGLDYTLDVNAPQDRRVTIHSMADGTPFDPDMMYRTVIASSLFGSGVSFLSFATGLDGSQIQQRLTVSSPTDIKYYAITQLALSKEQGDTVHLKHVTDWSLSPVPEGK